MSQPHLVTCIVCLLCWGSLARAAADPCDRRLQLKAKRGVVLGAAPLPSGRFRELRKIVLRDFRARARKRRCCKLESTAGVYKGKTYHQPRVKRGGRLTIGQQRVDLVEARFVLVNKDPRQLVTVVGRDELWVFWGAGATKPGAVIQTGSPGESGSVGGVYAFLCGGTNFCALLWEQGQGAPFIGSVRVVKITAVRSDVVGRLSRKVARRTEQGRLLFSRRDGRSFLCLTDDLFKPRRRYRFELTAAGLKVLRAR